MEQDAIQVNPPNKSSRKAVWISFSVVIIIGLIGFLTYWIGWRGDNHGSQEGKKSATQSVASGVTEPAATKPISDEQAAEEILPSLFSAQRLAGSEKLSSPGNWRTVKFNTINDESKEKIYNSGDNLTSSGFDSSGANNPVQWSQDGKVMAYSTGESQEIGPVKPKSFQLVVLKNGKEEVALKDLEVAQIPNWLLLPSGDQIVYTKLDTDDESKFGTAKHQLYKYDIASRVHTKLVDNVKEFNSQSQLLLVPNNNTVSIIRLNYDTKELTLWSYSLKTNKMEVKSLYKPEGERIFPGSIVLSNDGSLAALRVRVGEIKILDLKSGNLTDLVSVPFNRSVNGLSWSKDNNYLAYNTTAYAAGDSKGEWLEVVKININTKEKTVIEKSPQKRIGLRVVGWSPDNRYLAYIRENNLVVYDSKNGKKQIVDNAAFWGGLIVGFQWVGFK